MVESTIVWNKFPDTLPALAQSYLVAVESAGTSRVLGNLWLPVAKKFQIEVYENVRVIAWAEMPVYTEGE